MDTTGMELVSLSDVELDRIIDAIRDLARDGQTKFVIPPKEMRVILKAGVWIDFDSIEEFIVGEQEIPLAQGNSVMYEPVYASIPTRVLFNWEKIPAPIGKKLRRSIRQALAALDKIFKLSQDNDQVYPPILDGYEAITITNLPY